MCQIIYVPKNKEVNLPHLDQAQTKNSDGYGVMWHEEGELKVFRTMRYNRLKQVVKDLTEFEKVVHLRNTTRGVSNLANAHPFPVADGYMMHNGTVATLYAKNGMSDSSQLAKMINDAGIYDYEGSSDLLKVIIGDKINRLVFMDNEGYVTIVNEQLGKWENGIWYSNEYHVCPATPPKTNTSMQSSYPHKETPVKGSANSDTYSAGLTYTDENGSIVTVYHINGSQYKTTVTDKNDAEVCVVAHGKFYNSARLYHEKLVDARKNIDGVKEKKTIETEVLTKVFVYGTLKRGNSNHRLLKDATYLGKAYTKVKYAMINNMGGTFPYLIAPHNSGNHVKGEVYAVTASQLRDLDRLEGTPSHYRRSNIDVNYNDGGNEVGILTYVTASATPAMMKQDFLLEWTSN